MKKGIDIYNHGRLLIGMEKCVRQASIGDRNKDFIFRFRDFCSLDGMSLPRMIRYLGILKDWALLLEVDFDKATKEDVMRAVRILQDKPNYTAWTKSTYKVMLKRFFKWLKNSGMDSPEEVRWIRTELKRTEKNLPANGDLLTEEDIKRVIRASDHPRDKALISTLYESGARIGELATLQIGNVKFDQYGAVLNVQGKTGPRPIRIISSTPYLVTWIESHADKDNSESPLWINIGSINHNQAMHYATIRSTLQRVFRRAGVKKKFNPHIFRHSRATHLADHLTEFQMNQYFGWIQGSKMPSTYVHMSGKQIDSSILALNGIKQEASKTESVLKPKICPRCDTINAFDGKHCTKCAGILDTETAYQLEEKHQKEHETRKNYDEVMDTLIRDPEVLQMLVNKARELGLADKLAC